MPVKTRKKNKPLRKWARKAKQKGRFISLLIAGLTALGMSDSAAATTASIAAPIISGSLTAAGSLAVQKLAGKGRRPPPRRPLQRRIRRR